MIAFNGNFELLKLKLLNSLENHNFQLYNAHIVDSFVHNFEVASQTLPSLCFLHEFFTLFFIKSTRYTSLNRNHL